MLFFFGAIPIWFGQFGAAIFVTVWSVQWLFIVAAACVLRPHMSRRLVLFAACATVALINLVATFVFRSGINVVYTLPSSVHAELSIPRGESNVDTRGGEEKQCHYRI
jgi:hypothetical protein